MSDSNSEQIPFDVETSRILEILSSEIYDSPKALLRENVQNAYDAVLMRCTADGLPLADRSIRITLHGRDLVVEDDGIGMPEDVLRNNFWKAGASGKKTQLAQQSGVIGSFGIGAMANFGVCTSLKVETRHVASDVTLVSIAQRDELRIAQDCIRLERIADDRPPGTRVTAGLDESFVLSEESASSYLKQYVRFLPVEVLLNATLISRESFSDVLENRASGFSEITSRAIAGGDYAGTLQVSLNTQGQLLARLSDITLNARALAGEMFLIQQGDQAMGFRNLFGLAPIPITGHYQFGGFVDLAVLQPTAGREALSRESIQHVANLVEMIEAEASTDLAASSAADRNGCFQQYILAHNKTDLAHNVTITVLPRREEVGLGQIEKHEPSKTKQFYVGRDQTTLQRFASEQANLLHASQVNPRRKLQIRYVSNILKIPTVPDQVLVTRVAGTALAIEEAILLARIRGVLMDDYLMSNTDVEFATISHGVMFHVEKANDTLRIAIARDSPAVLTVLECFRTARDVFDGFVKDFVRQHLYTHIRDHVPSSTREGRDALYRRLQENKELFRYEESELGDLELLLADYLSGKKDLADVLRTSASRTSAQRQKVSSAQVGRVEEEIPDVVESGGEVPTPDEFEAAPPILRPDISSRMKLLTVSARHPKLNHFQMFLALSDRLFRREGEFFRWPHSTKMIWGVHRVIYIFTDATGGLALYYDIELREPLETNMTGGGMFATTTLLTKNRIYVPIPSALEPAFQIREGAKEFFVRFDTIP